MQNEELSRVRQEVSELIETLLDLIQQRLCSEAAAQKSFPEVLPMLQNLLQTLLTAYTATLGAGDRALLRALGLLETLLGQLQGREVPLGPLSRLSGPLRDLR